MRTTKAKVTCPKCGDVTVRFSRMTCIYNGDTNEYTMSFKHCGKLNVKRIDLDLCILMQSGGAKFMQTSLPVPSHRPWGPPIDETDLASAVQFMKHHNALAAYA